MNIKLYLDKRSVKKNGCAPIKVAIIHLGKSALLSTGIDVEPERWDSDKLAITRGSDKQWKMQDLRKFVEKVEMSANTIVRNATCRLTANEIKKRIVIQSSSPQEPGTSSPMGDDDLRDYSLLHCYFDKITNAKTGRTKNIYEVTLKKIKAFVPTWEVMPITTIDRQWLERFDDWLSDNGCNSADTRSMYMRCLKHVLECAIDDDLLVKSPFRKFKIKQETVKHKDLTVEDLRMLLNYKVQPYQVKYRDFFWLSFLLRGINPEDLLSLEPKNYCNGYIEYRRLKTGKWYRVKVEPEAEKLLKKYKGKNGHLLHFRQQGKDHTFCANCNKQLKNIGVFEKRKCKKSLFPNLTLYWARHTWATLAYSVTDDFKSVEIGLGHKSAVTDRYVREFQDKVDATNRKVIDYVLDKNLPK